MFKTNKNKLVILLLTMLAVGLGIVNDAEPVVCTHYSTDCNRWCVRILFMTEYVPWTNTLCSGAWFRDKDVISTGGSCGSEWTWTLLGVTCPTWIGACPWVTTSFVCTTPP